MLQPRPGQPSGLLRAPAPTASSSASPPAAGPRGERWVWVGFGPAPSSPPRRLVQTGGFARPATSPPATARLRRAAAPRPSPAQSCRTRMKMEIWSLVSPGQAPLQGGRAREAPSPGGRVVVAQEEAPTPLRPSSQGSSQGRRGVTGAPQPCAQRWCEGQAGQCPSVALWPYPASLPMAPTVLSPTLSLSQQ